MKMFTEFVTRYRKTVILLILILTGFFIYQMPQITIDNSINNMLPADHPARETFDKVSDTFGNSDILVVAMHADSLFSRSALTQVCELTRALESVPGVREVRSLSTARYMRGTDWGMEVEDLMPEPPATRQAVEDLRFKVGQNGIYEGTIISEDRSYAGFVLRLTKDADDESVYKEVQTTLDRQPNATELSVAGSPAVNAIMADSMKHDLTRLLPFVLILVLVSLYFSFRSLQGVLLPLLTVLVSVIWTLGLMALLSIPMAMVSTILPVLLIAIGSAYGIHAINGYYESLLRRLSQRKAIVEAMDHVGKAILMAGLTTVVGFGALALSSVSQIRSFGLFTAFGVAVALLLSVTFVPAILALLKVPDRIDPVDGETSHSLLDRVLIKLATVNLRYKKGVILAGIALFFFSGIGIPRLAVETNTLRFFPAHSNIRQATEVINDHFGGSENLSLYLRGDMKDPEVLRRMLRIQAYADSLEHVGFSISIADYVAEINKALNGNDPAFRRIPDSREAVAQEILLYTMSGDPGDFEQVVDYDFRRANISIRIESVNSRELDLLVDQIEQYARSQAGETLQVDVTGSSYLFKVLTDLLVHGQIYSLIASLGLVWLIVTILFRSVTAGGFSIIPLTLTIALNFGLMGWLQIPLDTATTMLASMAIGIGVDYSIHFLSRYRREVQHTGDHSRAAVTTTHTSGKAIFFNAIAVTSGFVVLLFSTFRPIQTLGLLTAFTMVTASLGALTILPALLSGLKPKFLSRNHQNT